MNSYSSVYINLYTPNVAYRSNLVYNQSFFSFPPQFLNILICDICWGGVPLYLY